MISRRDPESNNLQAGSVEETNQLIEKNEKVFEKSRLIDC